MLRLLAAVYVGYYIGKRGLSQAVEDTKIAAAQVEELSAQVEAMNSGTNTGPVNVDYIR